LIRASEFRAQVLRLRKDGSLRSFVVQLSTEWFQPMIRKIAILQVTASQDAIFCGNRPLAAQDANMACFMSSFRNYVDRLEKTEKNLIAKEKIAASKDDRSSSSSDLPQVRISSDPVPSKRLFERFLDEQTRPKTLFPVLNFLKLRGHEYNDAAEVPNAEYSQSKAVVVKVIRDAILSVTKGNDEKAIFIFKDICTFLNIRNNVNNVNMTKLAAKPKKEKQSFHKMLGLMPDKEKCMELITTLEWNPDISFPLVKTA